MPRVSMPRKNARVALRCRRCSADSIVAHRLVGEERRQQRAEGVDLQRHAGVARGVGEAGGELRAEPRELLVELRRQTRSSDQSPAVIASGLPDSVPA